MEEKAIKVGATGIGAILTYISGSLTPIVYIFVLFEVMDYISGIASAAKGSGLDLETAVWGFLKKFFNFFIITVAFCFDFVLHEVKTTIGITANWPAIFGILSLCYLTSVEAISILENLSEFGIKVPFLTGALKTFRDKVISRAEQKPMSENEER